MCVPCARVWGVCICVGGVGVSAYVCVPCVCVHMCGCVGVSAYVRVPCACMCTCVGAAQWQGQMSIFHVGRVFSPQLTKNVHCGCTWTLSNT